MSSLPVTPSLSVDPRHNRNPFKGGDAEAGAIPVGGAGKTDADARDAEDADTTEIVIVEPHWAAAIASATD